MAGSVFIAAFKVALKEASSTRSHSHDPDLPRAEIHSTRASLANPWHRGSLKQKLVRQVHYLQAALVAFGITSVFIMFLCMMGILVSMLFGTV